MSDLKTETKPEGYYLYTGSEITWENRYRVYGYDLFERTVLHELAPELCMDLETCGRFALVMMDCACQAISLAYGETWCPDQWDEMETQLREHSLFHDPDYNLLYTGLEHVFVAHRPLWRKFMTCIEASLQYHWTEPQIPEHVAYFEANPNL